LWTTTVRATMITSGVYAGGPDGPLGPLTFCPCLTPFSGGSGLHPGVTNNQRHASGMIPRARSGFQPDAPDNNRHDSWFHSKGKACRSGFQPDAFAPGPSDWNLPPHTVVGVSAWKRGKTRGGSCPVEGPEKAGAEGCRDGEYSVRIKSRPTLNERLLPVGVSHGCL
jgi:hypothetical protein